MSKGLAIVSNWLAYLKIITKNFWPGVLLWDVKIGMEWNDECVEPEHERKRKKKKKGSCLHGS